MRVQLALSWGIVALAAAAAAQPPAMPELASLSGRTSGDEGDGFAFAAVVEGAPGPLLYLWDFGDGTAPVTKFDASDMNHRYADDGNYRVSLTVEGVGGSARRELEVVVRPAPPKIHLLLAERESDGSYRFTAEASDPGEDEELTYRWELGDGSPPAEGVDLTETRHRYERDGVYTLTLTVRDEDDLVASESQRLLVGDAVDVTVTGALNTRIRSGEGPTSVCPVPLGDGGCGLHLQYWDDANRSYLFLQLYGKPVLAPRDYPMVHADDRHLARGVPVAEATGIVAGGFSPDDYRMLQEFLAVTECRNAGKTPLTGGLKELVAGGFKGMGKGLLKSLPGGGLLGGGGGSGASGGSGGGFAAVSGRIEIDSADENRVAGGLRSTMRADKPKPARTVEVEGVFAAEFDEFATQFLDLCEPGPFQLVDRSPKPDAERVDFALPEIRVRFTRPLDPSSVTTDGLFLESLAADGQYRRVPIRLLHDGEGLRVHLLPVGGLDPARIYRVTIAGGERGPKSRTGEPLAGNETWSFSTMPDLYRDASGGSAAASFGSPAGFVPAVLRGRTGTSPAQHALRARSEPAPIPVKNETGAGAAVPRVSCRTYQATGNMPLVKGKATAFRVYLDWDLPDAARAAQVTELEAEIEVTDGAGVALPGLEPLGAPNPFRHRSIWEADASLQSAAGHTANFAGWAADPSVGRVVATAKVEDDKGVKHEFSGECPIDHWGVDDATLRFGFFVLPVGAWETGEPDPRQLDRFLQGSLAFLQQNFPVSKVSAELLRAVTAPGAGGRLRQVVLPESSSDRPLIVFNDALEMMLRLRDAIARDGLSFDVVVGLHPPGINGWEQSGYNYSTNDGEADAVALFPANTVRVTVDPREADGSMTLAHEVGHGFGLHHVPSKSDLLAAIEAWRDSGGTGLYPDRSPWRIEGLRVALDGSSALNKSTREGNGEAAVVLPLMYPLDQLKEKVFVADANYVALMSSLKRYFESR